MYQVDSIEQTIADTALAAPVHVADSSVVSQAAEVVQASTVDTLQVIEPSYGDTLIAHLDSAQWPVMAWGDTLVKPQSLYQLLHAHGEPLQYSLTHDNWLMGLLFGCFIFLVCILAWSYKFLMPQARQFFVPTTNNQNAAPSVKTPAEIYAPLFMVVLLCCYDGLLAFAFVTKHFDVQSGIYPIPLVLGVSIGIFVLYNLLRWLLYSFVNWIFFKPAKIVAWRDGYAFLITLESVLFLPVVAVAINTSWDYKTTLIVVLSAIGLTRFCLLCHSFRTFFPNLYGILHLFAYLCTLELIPLLAVWKAFMVLGEFLIAK